MKKLIIILTLFVSTCVTAQTSKKILVADETYYQTVGEKTFRVITANEKIRTEITKIGNYTSVCAKQAKDRNGLYWEYTYLFPIEIHNKFVILINQLNK